MVSSNNAKSGFLQNPPFLLHIISSPGGRILSLGLEIFLWCIDEEGIRIM